MMDIKNALNEYKQLTEREKTIRDRKKQLADFIKQYSTKNGVQDDKGSYYIDDEDFTYGSQARKSVKLNFERAKNFFVSKGVWDKVVKYEEVIDEDKVSNLIDDELMSIDDLETITDVKVTYAIDVRAKEKEEDMPEVEVVETSSKPRPILKIKKK